jgi:putative FmdB family regulatory protein
LYITGEGYPENPSGPSVEVFLLRVMVCLNDPLAERVRHKETIYLSLCHPVISSPKGIYREGKVKISPLGDLMPIYEFTCQSCGLRFEKLFRKISTAKEFPCTSCGAPGKREVSAASFAFKHPPSQTRGMAPPNTGTSDDWNFDKAIGRDAEMRWGEIHKDGAKKDQIVHDEAKKGRGITRDHLVKTREGGYRVITERGLPGDHGT